MKNLLLLMLIFSNSFSLYAMQAAHCGSSPRNYLIPLDVEQTAFKSLMDSPPRQCRSSRSELLKELSYIDFGDRQKVTSKIIEVIRNGMRITAKAGEDFALILPTDTVPVQVAQFVQWQLKKHPAKLELIGNAFANPQDPSDDSIAFIFTGKSQGSEELLFSKETIGGDCETRIIQIDIE